MRRQLSRWTAAGEVVQLRRDVYVLADPWRRVDPHPFLVANELSRPSYVSLQSALAYHGLLDLVYLTPGGDSAEHLASLRLDLGALSEETLLSRADRWGKPKLERAARTLLELRAREVMAGS